MTSADDFERVHPQNADKSKRLENRFKNNLPVYAKQTANITNNFRLPNKIYAEYISFVPFFRNHNVISSSVILSLAF